MIFSLLFLVLGITNSTSDSLIQNVSNKNIIEVVNSSRPSKPLSYLSSDKKRKYLEGYIKNKRIKYKLGALGPVYYDCGAVVTEALRNIGYQGFKLNSSFYLMEPRCKQPLSSSKKGDILINTNEGQGHVALITSNLGRGVEILDFVAGDKQTSSYRQHGSYSGVYSLNTDCLLSQKYWLDKKLK